MFARFRGVSAIPVLLLLQFQVSTKPMKSRESALLCRQQDQDLNPSTLTLCKYNVLKLIFLFQQFACHIHQLITLNPIPLQHYGCPTSLFCLGCVAALALCCCSSRSHKDQHPRRQSRSIKISIVFFYL